MYTNLRGLKVKYGSNINGMVQEVNQLNQNLLKVLTRFAPDGAELKKFNYNSKADYIKVEFADHFIKLPVGQLVRA
jgi:hypothetical protein